MDGVFCHEKCDLDKLRVHLFSDPVFEAISRSVFKASVFDFIPFFWRYVYVRNVGWVIRTVLTKI